MLENLTERPGHAEEPYPGGERRDQEHRARGRRAQERPGGEQREEHLRQGGQGEGPRGQDRRPLGQAQTRHEQAAGQSEFVHPQGK